MFGGKIGESYGKSEEVGKKLDYRVEEGKGGGAIGLEKGRVVFLLEAMEIAEKMVVAEVRIIGKGCGIEFEDVHWAEFTNGLRDVQTLSNWLYFEASVLLVRSSFFAGDVGFFAGDGVDFFVGDGGSEFEGYGGIPGDCVFETKMRALAKNRVNPPDRLMCPSGWEVLVE
ncbi:hypothetical protein LINGRAHAP2_LOCUS23297 [Linum grandiflorum]